MTDLRDSLAQVVATPMTAAELVNMSVLHPRFVRDQRNRRIQAMRREGKTLQSIGDEFGLTRARVQQICGPALLAMMGRD